MKDYRIEIKVKNNLLWNAMQKRGIKNAAQLARVTGLAPGTVGDYLNLKENVYDRYGNYKNSFERICNYFNMMPVELYPEERMKDPLLKNTGSVEVSGSELKQLSGVESDPLALIHQEQVQDAVHKLIDRFTPRQAKVIKMKHGINGKEHTYQEIGDELGVCANRARQIHETVLRRMRYQPTLKAAGIDRNIIGIE